MKFQIFIVLGLAATATVAVQNSRARRQASSSTESSCSSSSDSVGDLLVTVGNLLDNIIENLSDIELEAGNKNKGPRSQYYYVGLETEIIGVRDFLSDLLQSGSVDDNDENRELLSSIISDISQLLDALLGDGTSAAYSCSGGGIIGGLLQTLTDDNIIPVLTNVIGILNPTIRRMNRVIPRL